MNRHVSRDFGTSAHRCRHAPLIRRKAIAILAVVAAVSWASPHASANDSRPYDTDLLRLSEILGSVHYLRAICNPDDGQIWRDEMAALIAAEGSSARRRVVLTRRFNRGYTNYSRTYRSCTRSAKTALSRFFEEADRVSERLLQFDRRSRPSQNADVQQ